MRASTSTVMTLLEAGCPLAIIRRVRPIVINAFYGESFWWISHVLEEIFKVVPLIANVYSAASVILKSYCFMIVTALHHRCPNHINFGSCHLVCLLPDDVLPTPTRFGRSARKTLTENGPYLTAVASTKVLDLVVMVVLNTAQHFNHGKPFSGKIDSFHAGIIDTFKSIVNRRYICEPY